MKGADEFAPLFKTGQYGRLYITSSSHARGLTFRIQVLPEGEKAIPNGIVNQCLNNNAVDVYGITGGQNGWTETYGWLHKGKWCEDFERLVKERKEQIEKEKNEASERKEQAEKERQDRKMQLLNAY